MRPDEGFPLELAVKMARAVVAHRDDVTWVLDGEVNVQGKAAAMDVTGAVTVNTVTVNLDALQPGGPSIPDVQIVEVGNPGAVSTPEKESEASAPVGSKIDLDLAIDIPDRVYVQGLGLDSVWGGKLRVRGAASEPRITGEVKSQRGEFDFFGREFTLQHGKVTFLGDSPPNPRLDVKAVIPASDVVGVILVTGSPAEPSITLASEPPLPQDEVLARVLFGRDVSSLSMVEALRLAQAATFFAGGVALNNFLGHSRQFLSLDKLHLVPGGAGLDKSMLGYGQNLTDKVKVNVERSLGSQYGQVSVEVKITPNITLESSANADNQQGVELNWKYDY